MKRFLLAKHWQLFLLTFGLAIIFDIVIFTTAFGQMAKGNSLAFFNVFKFFPLIMLIYVGITFGWFWAVGITLQNKVPETVTMKTTKFKIFFTIPFVYILLITIFLGILFFPLLNSPNSGNGFFAAGYQMGIISIIIIPLHLFSMFGILYCLYFAAKTLKTIELQREVTFSDFAGEFFLIWFFPIGIWFIQPRINRLMQEDPTI